MRLTGIETAIVSLSLKKPVRTTIQRIDALDCVLVTLNTDAGLSGIGYLWCFGIERARLLEAAVKDLFVVVRGRDATHRLGILGDLWAATNFLGSAGVTVFGLSAIDMALWDIAGKARQEPLHKLLGAEAAAVDVYAGGLWLSDPIDAIVGEAKTYVSLGYRAMKMRVGAQRWQDDVARVEAVRAAIGPDVVLMVDATQSWKRDQAVKIARELERFHLGWIEEPLVYYDLEGLAAVAAAVDTPIAGGENDYGLVGFRRLIDARAVDVVMPDLQRVGGITEWLNVALLAESIGMRVAPHVFPEISVHLLSAIPNGFRPEYVDWWDPLFVEPLRVSDGTIRPSSTPGLGLAFNWETLDRHRIT